MPRSTQRRIKMTSLEFRVVRSRGESDPTMILIVEWILLQTTLNDLVFFTTLERLTDFRMTFFVIFLTYYFSGYRSGGRGRGGGREGGDRPSGEQKE